MKKIAMMILEVLHSKKTNKRFDMNVVEPVKTFDFDFKPLIKAAAAKRAKR